MPADRPAEPLPPLAILAGGMATRLRPLTETMPKSMVEVASEPFIAHQLRLAAAQGVTDIVLCLGHLGRQIEEFAGDGARFGCRVRYSYDGAAQLGTGGALRQALPLLGQQFLVMYGDSYLPTRFRPVYDAFLAAKRPALMAVFRNDGRWDASNIEFSDGRIRRYDKVDRRPAMRHIDYGLAVIAASAFEPWPPGRAFDLADLYRDLLARDLLAGYEVFERFYEIGSPAGLEETDAFLRTATERSVPARPLRRGKGDAE